MEKAITKARLNEMLKEELGKAKAIGLDVINLEEEVEIADVYSFYGQLKFLDSVWRADRGLKSGVARVRISKYYLKAPESQVRQTIAHEICHAVIGTRGHNKAWKVAANKFNIAYGYTLKRCGGGVAEGEKKFSLDNEKSKISTPKVLACNDCNQTWVRYKETKFVKHPEWYKCSCGGEIKRVNKANDLITILNYKIMLNVSYENRIGYFTWKFKGHEGFRTDICHANCFCAFMYFYKEDGEDWVVPKAIINNADDFISYVKECPQELDDFHFNKSQMKKEFKQVAKMLKEMGKTVTVE